MPDISNQQVLDTLITAVQQTKQDLTADIQQVKTDLTNDLRQMESNLSRRIKASHTTNIHHHLETRAMIGDLDRKFTNLTEVLAQAGREG